MQELKLSKDGGSQESKPPGLKIVYNDPLYPQLPFRQVRDMLGKQVGIIAVSAEMATNNYYQVTPSLVASSSNRAKTTRVSLFCLSKSLIQLATLRCRRSSSSSLNSRGCSARDTSLPDFPPASGAPGDQKATPRASRQIRRARIVTPRIRSCECYRHCLHALTCSLPLR
jgi:hypothetical protein